MDNETEDEDEETDEEDPVRAVRITREYRGPVSGRHKFDQRCFKVVFSDGTAQICVAEDVAQEVLEPFERNPFYTSVISDWRTRHPSPPIRPDPKQNN